MSTQEKISASVKDALRAGQSFEAGLFRMLLSALHNKEIEKKGKGGEEKLSEEEVIDILSKEAKKRKESISAYEKGGREDLAEKERKELKIIEGYLPEQMGREEVEKIVLGAVKKTGAKDAKDFGLAMKEAMAELKGKADASLVSQILKEKLG